MDFATTAFVVPRLGITAELGGHHGWKKFNVAGAGQFRVERTTLSYLFGPHIRLINTDRLVVGARALLGVARGEFATPGMLFSESTIVSIRAWQNSFAGAFGGTVDLSLSERVAWRVVRPDLSVTRFGSSTQTDFRVATGIVIRFGRR